ncbi:MAG TPA: hypothetical protein DCQ83_08285 [Fibrobacteres bacterium]|jgi:hypothetical protein|nr:hypothetical protein [Fibrobacterota bacterium]
MKNFLDSAFRKRITLSLFAAVAILVATSSAQSLPTGVSVTPIYDTTQAGLSFRKDKLPYVGMWEVPGKPKHFLVVGYFGYMWTLYPDTNAQGVAVDTTVSYGTVKKYTRTQVADFNTWVMKGWEFGALGGSFDPNFKTNHYFYVIYNKYPVASQYRAGTTPSGNNDGPNNPTAIVVVDRYIMSADFKSVARDTEMIRLFHGTGYGSSNMVFGNDGMLYITTDAYNLSSWDSTITGRKILRINVSQVDPARACGATAYTAPSNTNLPCGIYTIPSDNPWYNVSNPAVRKEVYAFGFRNTYSLSFNYLTNQLYGAETGQSRWEEINHILPGRNYGWNNGGDNSTAGANSSGIEGPCHVGANLDSTSAGGGYTSTNTNIGTTGTAGFITPYTRTVTGTAYNGTYTCANFQNAAWYTGHATGATDNLANSAANSSANVGNISPVIRGDVSSPFYGYMIISDINGAVNGVRNRFFAAKVDRVAPVFVGNFPTSYAFSGDQNHNGITTWSEDSYGNLYPIVLSSSSSGAFQWHDIFMLTHAQLTPLATPRSQVVPVPTGIWQTGRSVKQGKLMVSAMPGSMVNIPQGYSGVTLYNLQGREVWSYRGNESSVQVPSDLEKGILQAKFTR